MGNWINGKDVFFYRQEDRDYWDKLCKEVEDGKVPHITFRGVEYTLAKHGKWIYEPKDAIEMMHTKPKCSECGYESADGLHYCPNCGAKMEDET